MEDVFVPQALKASIRLIDKIIRSGLGVMDIARPGHGKSSIILGLQRYYERNKVFDKIVSLGGVNLTTLAMTLSGTADRLLVLIDDMASITEYGNEVLTNILPRLLTEGRIDKYMVGGKMPLEISVKEYASVLLGFQPKPFFDFVTHTDNFANLAMERFFPIIQINPIVEPVLPNDEEFWDQLIEQALSEPDPLDFRLDESKLKAVLNIRFSPTRASHWSRKLIEKDVHGLELYILLISLALVDTHIIRDEMIRGVSTTRFYRQRFLVLQAILDHPWLLGESFTPVQLKCMLKHARVRAVDLRKLLKSVFSEEPGTETSSEIAEDILRSLLDVVDGKLVLGKPLRILFSDVLEKRPNIDPCDLLGLSDLF